MLTPHATIKPHVAHFIFKTLRDSHDLNFKPSGSLHINNDIMRVAKLILEGILLLGNNKWQRCKYFDILVRQIAGHGRGVM